MVSPPRCVSRLGSSTSFPYIVIDDFNAAIDDSKASISFCNMTCIIVSASMIWQYNSCIHPSISLNDSLIREMEFVDEMKLKDEIEFEDENTVNKIW